MKRPEKKSRSRSNLRVPEEFRQASRGPRLQKVMAEAGVASRRDCEQMIEQGRVTVNGQPVAALPAWVDPFHDRIEIDGKPLRKPSRPALAGSKAAKAGFAPPTDRVYIILNKPRQTLTTTDDPDRRRHVMDMVPSRQLPGAPRLFPVGRLDADSTGLLLLTNDGDLANRLTHPSFGISKTYRVAVRGKVELSHINQLESGLYLAERSTHGRLPEKSAPSRFGAARSSPSSKRRPEGSAGKPSAGAYSSAPAPKIKRVHVDRVRIVSHKLDRSTGDRTILEVTLHEGHNRVIRRMLSHVGLKVRRLQRVAIGPLKLQKLPIGHWRFLEPFELKSLRKAAGLKV